MKKRGGSWKSLIFLVLVAGFFLFGWFSNNYYKKVSIELKERPYGFSSSEKYSPKDRIKSNQIIVYDSMVVLNISNIEWSEYEDTNSMDPLLDKHSNGLEVKPEKEEDITVGDVIVYKPKWASGFVIHRVVSINEDEQGRYYIVKGDNSDTVDPEKVRFDQVAGILVGIIY